MTEAPGRVVLGALDATAAARPVLETAIGIGGLVGATVEAVHVGSEAPPTLCDLAERAGVPLRVVAGTVDEALPTALDAPEILVGVVGARSRPSGRRPVGGVTAHVLVHATKPVVIVPPDAPDRGALHRLLVPLAGTVESTRAVMEALCPLVVSDAELIVLHVFTDETVPRMLDRPRRDMEMLGREFLAHHFPPGTHVDLRPGTVIDRVTEEAEELGADLVVLSWTQVALPGRGGIVQEVLGTSRIPVLVLPVGDGRRTELVHSHGGHPTGADGRVEPGGLPAAVGDAEARGRRAQRIRTARGAHARHGANPGAAA